MKAFIKDGVLTITMPVETTPEASKSGKTLIIATTHGNQKMDGLEYKGKPVTLGLTAYIKKD